MQRNNIKFLIILVVAIVSVGVWLLKHEADRPVVSLNSLSGEAHAATANGEMTNSFAKDATTWTQLLAATRSNQDLGSLVARFKGANDCLLYHGARREVDSMLSDERWDDLSGRTPETLENMDSSSERSVRIVQQLETFCSDSDERQLISVAREAVFAAALKGSHEAAACFVLFGPASWQGPGYPIMEPMVARYLKYAPEFTSRALESGDPIVAVRALHRYIATPPLHPSEVDDLPKADPLLTWRAARLASLRAQPQQRALVERDLMEFGKLRTLSASDITRADAWAKETFDRQFSGQAPIDLDFPIQCYSRPSLIH